jgi:hypothetical protein
MKSKKPKEQTMPTFDPEIKPFVGFDPSSESSPLREEYLELKEEGYSDENIAAELSVENIKLAWKMYQMLEYDPVVFVMNQANNASCRAIYYKTAWGKYGKIDLHSFAEMNEEDIAYFSRLAEIPLERN